MKLEVALVQTRTPDDHQAALSHLEPLIREAAAGGAKLVLTPEASNLLQRDRERLFPQLTSLDDDPVVARGQALAQELGLWLLLGSVLVREGDGAANRSVLIDDGGRIAARYDKLHMFDVDLPTGERHRESASYRPGDRAAVAETPWGALGMTICYDLRFPHLFRRLAQAGAQMIAAPSAFTRPTGEAHWEVLLRARAIETGAFVLAPAQGGLHADGRETWGRSMVVGPWGEIVAQADGDEPGVVFANLDLNQVERARRAIPAWNHEREFAGP